MHNQRNENTINVLVSKYEAMSQKGVVGFIEEAVFGQLVDYYIAVQHSERAIEVLEHAIEQHPYSAGFYIQYGEILIYNGLFEEALVTLRKAAMFEPNSTAISILKVNALMEMQYYDEAFSMLEKLKLLTNKTDLSRVYSLEAELQELCGNYSEMYNALKAALIADPQNIEAIEAMMWAVEMNGNYEESIVLHKQIIDEFPYSENAWFNLGQAYTGLDKHSMAVDAFEYVNIINPEHEYGYRERVHALIQTKEFEKALDCYDEAILYITPDSTLLLNVGICYEALEKYKIAIKYYLDTIEISPNNEQACHRLGACYNSMGENEKAVNYLKKAVKINPRKEEYLAALADCFFALGKIDNARRLYQKAADTAPEVSEYWLKYAAFLLKISQVDLAIKVLDEAEVYAEGVELSYCRVVCLFYLNKEGEALYILGEVLMENYEKHSIIFKWMPTLKDNKQVKILLKKYNPF